MTAARAAAEGSRPGRRWLRVSVRVVLLLVALVVLYLVVTFVQVWRASTSDSHRRAEAIIVLGAAQYDGEPSPVLRRRLDHAIELFADGAAPVIVVTGGKQPGDRFTEAAASYSYLRSAGIADGLILREEQGVNTWEQVAAATRFLRDRDIDDVIFVSDDYHAYRVERIAHELGLRAQVSPVDSGLGFGSRLQRLLRETGAVAIGRITGFRRLVSLERSL